MWDSISSVRGLVRSSVRMLQRKKRSLLGRSRDWQLHAPSLCIGSLRHVSSYTLVDATGGAQSTVQGVQTSTARGLPTMPTKATCVDLPSNPAYHVAPLSGMFDGAAIHPQAIVSEEASIGQGVRVGPFCVVGPEVTLEAGVELQSHVVVSGRTIVGADSTIYPFASIGAKPQDLKYKGEVSELRIGQRCKVFEYSHLSGGTAGGGGVTQIGDDCLLMSHVHVGHDCNVGNRVVVASNAALAGHVQVGDGAQISGYACVHQRVCVGSGAFLAAASVLVADLIPFGLAVGNRATLETINMRGVRRQRAPQAEQRAMLRAFRYIFDLPRSDRYYAPLDLPRLRCLEERAMQVQMPQHPRVTELVNFILATSGRSSRRPLCKPRAGERYVLADSLGLPGT
mmetsp:Transcript_36683/g.77324  ORF Transcript_36683/g.77324 Transcript_36683/m.77324 type:complete len:397 (+) Transcript_36683:122-1312(+)